MVNPRVQKAVETTLDFFDLVMTPRRWSTKMRRAYVMTFPVSFPLICVVNLLIMTTVILAGGVCGLLWLAFKLFDYLKELWSASHQQQGEGE